MRVEKDAQGRFLIEGAATADELMDLAASHYWGKLDGTKITGGDDAGKYLQAKISHLEHEVFYVMFLTNRHEVITGEIMFNGTIDGAAVYPREVARAALEHNAAALILAHNHPSGEPTPSQADRQITDQLVKALGLLEIRILDHLVVGRDSWVSLAEKGYL